jgi:hypothetical protein
VSLRALLIATTIAGVSLPHLLVGEVAGSGPSLLVGVVVGLGCLRLALMAGSRGGRALGGLGIAAAALAPVVAYLAQEAAEREPGLEAAHAEPSVWLAMATQAPLIILALIAVRLLLAVVGAAVRALSRGVATTPRSPHSASTSAPPDRSLLPSQIGLLSSNGQRAPPRIPVPHRLAPLG